MGVLNDGLRFLLELSALAALAYWGFTAAGGVSRWVLAFAAPLVMAVAWGAFIAPRAALRVEDPVRIVAEVLIFGVAVAALAAAGRPRLAIAFAVMVAVHLALTFPLGQR